MAISSHRENALAQYGYSQDRQRDKPQIVFGLLCAAGGYPVAVEVFDRNTADPTTLAAPVEKLRQRFHFKRVGLVGDRGMITAARIEADLKPAGLDWITAPDYSGERLMVCRNPALAGERAQARGLTGRHRRRPRACSALDGFYVLRTNVAKADLDSAATVLPRWNGRFERLR